MKEEPREGGAPPHHAAYQQRTRGVSVMLCVEKIVEEGPASGGFLLQNDWQFSTKCRRHTVAVRVPSDSDSN